MEFNPTSLVQKTQRLPSCELEPSRLFSFFQLSLLLSFLHFSFFLFVLKIILFNLSLSLCSNLAALSIIHDVFGWSFPNARLLADKYAKGTGARVYLPDLFSGEDLWTQTGGDLAKLQKEVSVPDFLAKYPPRDAPNKTIEAYAAELKTKHEKLASLGFCWGGLYRFASDSIEFCSR